MSRTYRKSPMDNHPKPFWAYGRYQDYYLTKNRDGRNNFGCLKRLVKDHSDKNERANNKKMILDYKRGIDPDEIILRDKKDLRYIWWCYD